MGSTVLVEMFGLPTDTLKGQRAYRAKMASSNTFNVVYAENFFSFKKVILKSDYASYLFNFCFYTKDNYATDSFNVLLSVR
jgi:hypothetical protein